MGMSTHIVGFKPPDAKFRAMVALRDACEAAEVPYPAEVKTYFGGAPEEADSRGVKVPLSTSNGARGVIKWSRDMEDGFEVDLRALDPDIKILRFYNSY